MIDATAQFRFAAALATGFARSGIENVVISPGSRSSPFVLAAARCAALTLRTIIDERVAAFYALGQAKTLGRPTLLVCTSGSAPAHYLPALIEADASDVPLVVLSADRPPRLHGRGASQTIDQQKLFGSHVRAFIEIGGAECGEAWAARLAHGAVHTARTPHPGPVHVNVRFDKPLEPPRDATDREPAADWTVPRTQHASRPVAPQIVDQIVEMLRDASRPLVVAGPGPLRTGATTERLVGALSALAAPVYAECASQLRQRSYGPRSPGVPGALFRAPRFCRNMAPDLVLQLGAAPLATEWLEAAAGWSCRHVAVCRHGRISDPIGRATDVVDADPDALLLALPEALPPRESTLRRDEGWIESWAVAGEMIDRDIGTALDGAPTSDVAAVRRVLERSHDVLLVVGNSLPIRQIDLAPAEDAPPLRIVHQRGASGIDGHLGLAAGVASVVRGAETARAILLVGDVAFVHDLGGLATLGAETPLTVVLLDNGGGRLFERLPIGDRPDLAAELDAYYLTAPHVDFERIAGAFGIRYDVAQDAAALASLLSAEDRESGAARIVRVAVDAQRSREVDLGITRLAERAASAALSD